MRALCCSFTGYGKSVTPQTHIRGQHWYSVLLKRPEIRGESAQMRLKISQVGIEYWLMSGTSMGALCCSFTFTGDETSLLLLTFVASTGILFSSIALGP